MQYFAASGTTFIINNVGAKVKVVVFFVVKKN